MVLSGSHLTTGAADAIWRGRFKTSLLLVHRNRTSAYRSRLPLILLPWGLQQSPHSLAPRGRGERLSGARHRAHTAKPLFALVVVGTLVFTCTTSDMRKDPSAL
jgi:hypothetical protein